MTTDPLPFVSAPTRAIAAALEAALQWSYSSDMLTHVKVGLGHRKEHWSPEYSAAIETIREGVRIARKLGYRFKSLEIP